MDDYFGIIKHCNAETKGVIHIADVILLDEPTTWLDPISRRVLGDT